jgi:outer membrane usher protein
MCRSRSHRSDRCRFATRTVGSARARRRVRAGKRIARRAIAGGLAGALALNPLWCVAAGAGVGSGALSTSGLAPAALAPSLSMLPVPLVPAPEGETMLLAVRVNGVDRDDTVRVLRSDGRVWLSVSDWSALHLRAPTGQARRIDGQDYVALDMPGLRWTIDDASQTLIIDAPAAAFAGMTLRLDISPTAQTIPAAVGAFTNYDVELQRGVAGDSGNRPHSTSALLEVGAFGFGGSLDSTGLLMDNGSGMKAIRLDTTWTSDRPKQLASLRVGDGISRPGAWGNAMRFGGVQWATDFSLQPGLLTFPLPSVRGEASLPSTVDVYINNSRRMQSDVQPGPFDVADLPIVTGSGEVRLVVQDALGRQQVITQPYYVSPSLLKPGLHSYSYEIGAVRDDYGLASDHYGALIASATDRVGVTENFTRELRAEAQPDHAAAGATGIWLIPSVGVATLGAVGSVAHGTAGGSLMLSLERQAMNWNGSVQVRRSTAAFTQAGQSTTTADRTQVSVALGGTVGSTPVGMSYILQTPFSGTPTRLFSANLSHSLGNVGSIGLFMLRDFTSATTTVSLSVSMALDGRSSVALSSTHGSAADDRGSNLLQFQRNLPENEGLGFQATATNGQSRQLTAQAFARTGWADLNAGISHADTATDVRAGATGALAWMDDSVFATRRIDGSFAVVEVGDYPDVAVLRDHHEVARTDEHGRALVSGLRGYEVNRVGAEPADLPMDASVDALDIEFVPPAHAGVVLRLPIRRSRSATFRVVGADGMPLPAGTQLMLAGRDKTYPVGFDGRAYLAALTGNTVVRAHGAAGDCHFIVSVPAGDADDLPDIGLQHCL